jgi:hypothetical protein
VNFYEAEKVRVRKRILAPVASHRGVRCNCTRLAKRSSGAHHTWRASNHPTCSLIFSTQCVKPWKQSLFRRFDQAW